MNRSKRDASAPASASFLTIRLNVVVVAALLLLEAIVLAAYFRAHSAVHDSANNGASSPADSGGTQSLIGMARQRQQQLLLPQSSSSSPSSLSEERGGDMGTSFVGAFVAASNTIGALATPDVCPHAWESMPSADPKVSLVWMDGWMDGCMDGWMDGWMDGLIARTRRFFVHADYHTVACLYARTHANERTNECR